ncbi:MAG: type II secretion system protein [Ruminococcaceae bacterium]|nr:type II secretion system protein [Oscillospiraceae bacterium]
MFKFMKSKKGFSLVELMIVVVIMAILVAVAVPIFNSVTGNSRAKTCIDNQRSIISTLNTALLEKNVVDTTAQTIFVINKDDGTRGYYTGVTVANKAVTAWGTAMEGDTVPANGVFSYNDLAGLFQTVPYCPVENSAIQVVIDGNADGTATFTTTCVTNTGLEKDPHDLT